MKKLIYILVIFLLGSCTLFTIDRAHYDYRKDPKGYSEVKGIRYIGIVMPYADTARPNLYDISLITDTAQFNWAFWGNKNGIGYGDIPNVDFNTESLICGSIEAYGTESHIKKYKELIDENNKKILVKCLVKLTSGAYSHTLYIGFIIPKVTPDYEVKIDSWLTNY